MWSQRLKYQKIQTLLVAFGLLCVPIAASAQAVTQSYGVTGNLQQGMIVMLDPADSSKVIPLSNKSQQAMQGVVVAANEAAVTLSGDGTTNQAYVATSGKYDALVSNQNGPIRAGDLITISALDGIGMKADTSQSVVLGKALVSFDGSTNVSGTTTLTNSAGQKSNISLGLIQVNVGISHNPLAATTGSDTAVPAFLRKLAATIAGKPVSAPRIYISLVVLLVTFVISASLLYGGVRSSLTAIGRNPLAKGSVIRGLIQVMFIGIVIFAVGIAGVYLLIKL